MELTDLVIALMKSDALAARQWVADAARVGFDWSGVGSPGDFDPTERAVAAGIVEMFAARAGLSPPSWTADVPAALEPVFLVRAARTMPRLRRSCEEEGPAPLRLRRILAPPEFLTTA